MKGWIADGTDGADAFFPINRLRARVGRQTENGVSSVSGVNAASEKTGASGFGNWRNPDLVFEPSRRADDLAWGMC
jgi:hypothetical protein